MNKEEKHQRYKITSGRGAAVVVENPKEKRKEIKSKKERGIMNREKK